MCSEDKIVISEVANPEDETEFPVPESHHRVGAEDDCLLPQLGSRQFGENQSDHEGLDETAQHRLKIMVNISLLLSLQFNE